MKIILVFLVALLVVACSGQKKKLLSFERLTEEKDKDFVDHLIGLGDDYLKFDEIKTVPLRAESVAYLEKIYDRIVSNNEAMLQKKDRPRFYFVINKTPFLFSLPGSRFFISKGLVEKYLKSEELFVAALASEILKSQRLIYEKKLLIPLGFVTTEEMVMLTRIKPEVKFLVNEWTYFILKRSGFDASADLNWIQVQNRNTLDFSLFLGDAIGISREEHSFKNFMTRQGLLSIDRKINERNSSKEFYNLLSNLVRI